MIYSYASRIILNNFKFDSNNVTGSNATTEVMGGVICSYNSKISMKDTVCDSNVAGSDGVDEYGELYGATGFGGAIYSTEYSTLTLNYVSFISNRAINGFRGAIRLFASCEMNSTTSRYKRNSASNGGAITAIEECIMRLNSDAFEHNHNGDNLINNIILSECSMY